MLALNMPRGGSFRVECRGVAATIAMAGPEGIVITARSPGLIADGMPVVVNRYIPWPLGASVRLAVGPWELAVHYFRRNGLESFGFEGPREWDIAKVRPNQRRAAS